MDILAGIARGMGHIHSTNCRTTMNTTRHQFVHRDLKPDNVLLQVQGGKLVPKIADFGLARIAAGLSLGVELAGTKVFLPPEALEARGGGGGGAAGQNFEVVRGATAHAESHDVWSFAVLMWCCLSPGVPLPFQEFHKTSDLAAHLRQGSRMPMPERYLRVLPPVDLPVELTNLITECWRTEATDRPSFVQCVDTLVACSASMLQVDGPAL